MMKYYYIATFYQATFPLVEDIFIDIHPYMCITVEVGIVIMDEMGPPVVLLGSDGGRPYGQQTDGKWETIECSSNHNHLIYIKKVRSLCVLGCKEESWHCLLGTEAPLLSYH